MLSPYRYLVKSGTHKYSIRLRPIKSTDDIGRLPILPGEDAQALAYSHERPDIFSVGYAGARDIMLTLLAQAPFKLVENVFMVGRSVFCVLWRMPESTRVMDLCRALEISQLLAILHDQFVKGNFPSGIES